MWNFGLVLSFLSFEVEAAGGSEYPLAVAFDPASPANYVAGGMETPQYVIIHQMDGTYEGTISWFQYEGSDVSTHYVMRSADGEITQMVRHADMAQHIGGWNPMSFGIEHEGYIDEPGWYTWETYTASARLTRWLCDQHAIPVDRDHILGHVEVPGASHTDPGWPWDWDMYMALVHDVVPEGRVEGVVVDRDRACVLTALEDTWITTTLESLDALDDDEMCFLAAGTELSYLHASEEMISQRRLTMDGDGPCAGIGELGTEAFIWVPSFSEPCAPADLAAVDGVTVTLGGVPTDIDEAGRFAFDAVAPGAYAIDVQTDGTWTPTNVPIDVAVYPGVRIVIALDAGDGPRPDPGTTTSGDDEGAGTDGANTDDGSADAAPPEDGGADASESDAGDPGSSGAQQDDPGAGGCGCGPPDTHATWLVVPLLAAARRRRR